jgi:alkylhydroperoxidase family enzyme
VILRVAQRCDGQYVWVQHVAIARGVGVSDAQIAALEEGRMPAARFNDRERTALAFVDEILDACHAEDDMFTAIRELFSPRGVLELLLLIGYFRMICSVMTTLEVEVESPFGAKILECGRDGGPAQMSVRGEKQCFN